MKNFSFKGYSNYSPKHRKATVASSFTGSKNLDTLISRLSQNPNDRELEQLARKLRKERKRKTPDADFQGQFTQFVIDCLNKFEASGEATPNWFRILVGDLA